MMGMETVKKFYEALEKDEQMRERVKELDYGKAPDKETAMAVLINFAENEGYSFTAEEAEAYFSNNTRGEVPDAELEGIAGAGSGDSYKPYTPTYTCRLGYAPFQYTGYADVYKTVNECRLCYYCYLVGRYNPRD
jgi:predicted ribosomally synthesized peptide with nif11-like leader